MAKLLFISGPGSPSDSDPIVTTESAATHDMVTADTNTIFRCTNVGGCVVEVQSGQEPGTTAEFVREGGALTFTGDGVTLVFDTVTFLAEAAASGSSVIVTILSATHALVRGDLAAA